MGEYSDCGFCIVSGYSGEFYHLGYELFVYFGSHVGLVQGNVDSLACWGVLMARDFWMVSLADHRGDARFRDYEKFEVR
jgi:hypothetical protein